MRIYVEQEVSKRLHIWENVANKSVFATRVISVNDYNIGIDLHCRKISWVRAMMCEALSKWYQRDT